MDVVRLTPVGFGRKDLFHLHFAPERVCRSTVFVPIPQSDGQSVGMDLMDAADTVGSYLVSKKLTGDLALLEQNAPFRLALLGNPTQRQPADVDVLVLSGDHYRDSMPIVEEEGAETHQANRQWMADDATDWGHVGVMPVLQYGADTNAPQMGLEVTELDEAPPLAVTPAGTDCQPDPQAPMA